MSDNPVFEVLNELRTKLTQHFVVTEEDLTFVHKALRSAAVEIDNGRNMSASILIGQALGRLRRTQANVHSVKEELLK